MGLLTPDDILYSVLKKQVLNIPEWGGDIYIREPSGLERSEFELLTKSINESDDLFKTIRGRCAVKCIVDEDGKRFFSDEQIDIVNSLSANALDRVLDAYREIALMVDDDIEKAAKN